MSLHTLHHHGPCKPSSCATFALNSPGGRAATGQNNIYWVYAHRVASAVSRLFATLQTVACQASLSAKGVFQARILECIGQYWLPYPSRALYFLLP